MHLPEQGPGLVNPLRVKVAKRDRQLHSAAEVPAGRTSCEHRSVSAADLSVEMMQQFLDSGSQEHMTVLMGAGASTSSGLPDWDTFAIRLLLKSGAVNDEPVAQLLMDRQDPMLVVEAARAAAGQRWDQILRAALYQGVVSEEPSPLHLAAVANLLDTDAPTTDLATLNFDTLLEAAIEQETGVPAESVTNGQRIGGVAHAVHHLHGVIQRDRSHQVILTLSEFYDVIADHSAWQADYIASAVARGALLIAGTSYRDPDLRHWLHAALKDKPDDRAAIVMLAREGFALTKTQFKMAREVLANQWRAVGIEPVLLEDHADAAQLIRELLHVHDEGYVAPQQRARAVWDKHADDFEDLQYTYVELLEGDARTMRSELGVTRLNLTLWLADGEGSLVRWAAHDRVYRDLEALRAVETGHDSQWIAGRALAGESLLHKDLEVEGTRRWKSVLALPISVPHPRLPAMVSAVLTIGLPTPAAEFEPTASIWGLPLQDIGNAWGERLGFIAFEEQWSEVS